MSDDVNKQKNLSALLDGELDELLMMKVQEKWQKVARVIASVMSAHNTQDEERLLLRIKSLVNEKRIESAGDIQRPRFSEIRLPLKTSAGAFGEGVAAYSRGDFALALSIFEPLSLNGEGGASWRIAEMYAKGLGVAKDIIIADKWYRKALIQGYLPAQESLNNLNNLEV
jgi:TPR repeat protein